MCAFFSYLSVKMYILGAHYINNFKIVIVIRLGTLLVGVRNMIEYENSASMQSDQQGLCYSLIGVYHM